MYTVHVRLSMFRLVDVAQKGVLFLKQIRFIHLNSFFLLFYNCVTAPLQMAIPDRCHFESMCSRAIGSQSLDRGSPHDFLGIPR